MFRMIPRLCIQYCVYVYLSVSVGSFFFIHLFSLGIACVPDDTPAMYRQHLLSLRKHVLILEKHLLFLGKHVLSLEKHLLSSLTDGRSVGRSVGRTRVFVRDSVRSG